MDFNFTVHIVDDDPEMRLSLKWLLYAEKYQSKLYASANDFLNLHDPSQPGCIILDIRMPLFTGLELQDYLNELGSKLPVIFVTGYGEVRHAVRAIKNGAINFLCKPFSADALLKSIDEAHFIFKETHQNSQQKIFIQQQINQLSSSEKNVFECLLLGYSNKLIAKTLNLAVKTVESNRSRLKRKFGINSISELVKMNFFLQKS